jgi:hypothetical protein
MLATHYKYCCLLNAELHVVHQLVAMASPSTVVLPKVREFH